MKKSFSFNQTHKLHFSYKVQEKTTDQRHTRQRVKKRTVKKKKELDWQNDKKDTALTLICESRGQKHWELGLQAYYAVNLELSVHSA